LIILIFLSRLRTSGLAHVLDHCVTGITLPPVDANLSFHCRFWLAGNVKKSHREFKKSAQRVEREKFHEGAVRVL
jgi:hypothetical protein